MKDREASKGGAQPEASSESTIEPLPIEFPKPSVDDPDAPDPRAPQMTWVHWVLYNIPPQATALPEDASRSGLSPGAMQGLNDWDKAAYGGPCPPIGCHRYVHKLYALDTILEGLQRPVKADIETAMQGHILEETKLVATYQK